MANRWSHHAGKRHSTRGLTCELSDQLLDGFIADVPRSSPALPLLSGTNLARGEGAAAEPPCDLRPCLKDLRLCATGDPYAARRLRAVAWRLVRNTRCHAPFRRPDHTVILLSGLASQDRYHLRPAIERQAIRPEHPSWARIDHSPCHVKHAAAVLNC